VQSRIASGTPDEKAYYWREWHNTVGRPEKELFTKWIALENKTAILNGKMSFFFKKKEGGSLFSLYFVPST
jgi:hypothetical protein